MDTPAIAPTRYYKRYPDLSAAEQFNLHQYKRAYVLDTTYNANVNVLGSVETFRRLLFLQWLVRTGRVRP